MGLQGMIDDMIKRADADLCAAAAGHPRRACSRGDRARSCAHHHRARRRMHCRKRCTRLSLAHAAERDAVPVLGITGTGGSGKSSLTDELVRRFRLDQDDRLKIAVIAVDPSRRKTGGALLGDRIRMNAINGPNIYMRSLATRGAGSEIAACLPDVIAACKCAGFDLIIVETSGIGQGDAAIVPHVDFSLYVMTPEYGAASQLEKIDMLDFADFVAINKFDRRGAEDALRDVRKQFQRNRQAFTAPRRPDAGVRHHRIPIQRRRRDRALPGHRRRSWPTRAWSCEPGRLRRVDVRASSRVTSIVPPHAAATWPRSPRRCAAITQHVAEQVQARARAAAADARRSACCGVASARRTPGGHGGRPVPGLRP